ncbi:universal stress protein [Salinisphaera hydrothermalis]|uniref:Universal stress protein UspA n=1 Tax=Salinisphaera hydrothermalis (strain C41B8) TaxID=1304275 RepID=A0A084IKH2_SALHC|nr:universal stress protein [Salinisphaera hydrothermalis]KEZ77206.1 Universal stress protein UspA [Salinisphaera hydrothermalis C41B8]
MGYETVLLDASSVQHRETIWDYTLRLAVQHGAYVTAIHQGAPEIGHSGDPGQLDVYSERRETELVHKFEALARRYAGVQYEWRSDEGDRVERVARHGLYADLIVMGQFDPSDRGGLGTYEDPVEIALMSGRPVLVLPRSDRFAHIASRVILAWNDSPQAARMVSAALPFLVNATTVDVVIVKEDVTPGLDAKVQSADGHEIKSYLARHHVNASVTTVPAGVLEVSEVLLSMVADKAADLLCMGVYGHPKLRQVAVGQTSAALMRRMMVPTFVVC